MVTTGANIPAKCRRITDIEHETDTITHRCVEALHKTFITPIDRDDIHRLITRMDDIMDYVEAAAERIELYELTTMTADVPRPRRRAAPRRARRSRARPRAAHLKDAAGDRSSCASTSTASRTRPTRSCAARSRGCSRRRRTRSSSSSGKRSTRTSRTRPTAARTSRTSSRAWSSSTPDMSVPTSSSSRSRSRWSSTSSTASTTRRTRSRRSCRRACCRRGIAVLWAAFFNFVALFIFAPRRREHDRRRSSTIKASDPAFVWVVIAGLLGAIVWNLLTWWWGLPRRARRTR